MGLAATVLVTTFLASAVEGVEMVTIVIGVGATRGWRSTLIGAAAGFLLLAVLVVGLGAALTRIPIDVLRLVVGALLLIFGLQWFTKGIRRVAARGLAGMQAPEVDEHVQHPGMDWVAFVIAFKGVVLEGLEVVFIVVTFGAATDSAHSQLGLAVIGGVAAVLLIGALGFSIRGAVSRIPRSLLQLIVGVMLTTFGTFWALEGLGVAWPAGDVSIAGLLVLYAATALALIGVERRRAFGLEPGV